MKNPPVAYINGELLPERAARITPFDRAFLYGEGLFETMRIYDGCPFAAGEHLERMAASSAALGIPLPCSGEKTAQALAQTIEANDVRDGYARLTVSSGSGDVRSEGGPGVLFIYVRHGSPYPEKLYQEGVSVVTAAEPINPHRRLSRHKTTSYLANLIAWRQALARGAQEALFLTADRQVVEGTRSNIFAAINGTLFTPPLTLGILPGITRQKVIALARNLGVAVREEAFSPSELANAEEVFLTSALMEVMPVRCVDAPRFPQCPGPLTTKLRAAYRELVSSSRGSSRA